MMGRSAVAALGAVALTAALSVACARDSAAQVASARSAVADDTASLSRLLNTVRGVDPLFCELTVRAVDQHGSWSNWGPMSGSALEVDSASAALVRWIQNEHKDANVVPRLRTAIRDSDGCVRRVAGSFLARVEHASAKAALMDALNDNRAEVREVAAFGLGMAEHPPAVDALIRTLRDDSPRVRGAAAWALGGLENKKAVPPLMTLLARDNDAKVRQAAAWAIGNIK